MAKVRQAEERDQEPDEEYQRRDGRQPFQPPIACAGPGRSQPADPADRGSHHFTSNMASQVSAVSTIEATIVALAQNLLVLSSKPAPMSSTKWRRPEAACWKKAQVRPMPITVPTQLPAHAMKLS